MKTRSIKFAFRMIHIQNIPHILQEGFVHLASMRASRHYVSIGDAAVILKRNNRFIDQVHRISDYIPFYFGPRTPMLYHTTWKWLYFENSTWKYRLLCHKDRGYYTKSCRLCFHGRSCA